MRTIRIKLYKFSELTKGAKQKALDQLRDINTDNNDWHDPVLTGAKEDLIAAGYENPEILYSGFYSQGDGACFTCSKIDFNKFMGGKYAAYSQGMSCSIMGIIFLLLQV
jgi:hypothetical protein